MAERDDRQDRRPAIPLQEQFLIWMSACFALVLLVTGLAGRSGSEFRVVPDAALDVSTAAGMVLVGFGLWKGARALLSRSPALSAGVFAVPFVGLLAWAAPFVVEAAFH